MIRRIAVLAVIGAASVTLASCGDVPTVAPSNPAVSRDVNGAVAALVACTPLPADSVTQVIGPLGGTMSIGPHSFTVPAGALDSAVTITAIAPSDSLNRIVFQPSGLTFSTPATLTLSYANCGLLPHLLPERVAYVDNLLNVLYYLPSVQNQMSQTVTGQVQHFSDYAVAW